MKKRSLILSLVAVATLAGCGPTASTGGDDLTTNKPGTKISFEFWHTLGQGLQDGLNDAIAGFEKTIKENEGVDVEVVAAYQGAYNDIKNKIESGIGGGNIPSVAVAYPDHVATYLNYGDQYVANLDDYMNNEAYGFGTQDYLGDFSSYSASGACDADDIVSAFYKEGQSYHQKGTYSLPWMKSSEIMFYNYNAVKKCFDKAKLGESFDENITSETEILNFMKTISWEKFIELAKFAQKHKDKVLPNMEAVIQYDSDANMFVTKMMQNKIAFASCGEDGRGRVDFETGEERTKAEAMATKYANLMKDGILQTKILTNDKYSSDYLSEEKLMFGIGSSGGAGYNQPSSSDQFRMELCRVPASNNNPTYVTQGPTLTLFKNANPKVTEYAWKFMKYITNTDVNNDLCLGSSQGYMPVRTSCYGTDYFSSFVGDETIYAQTAKVLLNDIDGNYFISDTFKGSDTLRNQCGTIIADAYGQYTKNGTPIEQAVANSMTNAINEAKKHF